MNSTPFMPVSLERVDEMVYGFLKWMPLSGLNVGNTDVKRLAKKNFEFQSCVLDLVI